MEAPPAKPAVVVVETPAVETVVQPVEPPPPVEETATPTIEETPVPVAPAEPVVEPRPAKAPHQLVERVLTQLAKPAVYPGKRTRARRRPEAAETDEPPRPHRRGADHGARARPAGTAATRGAKRGAREAIGRRGSALVAVRMSSSLDGRFSGDFGGAYRCRVPCLTPPFPKLKREEIFQTADSEWRGDYSEDAGRREGEEDHAP